MTDTSCPVCHCADWDHGVACIATRLVRHIEAGRRIRAEEAPIFDAAFLAACGIIQ
jgi:hypothetical protein